MEIKLFGLKASMSVNKIQKMSEKELFLYAGESNTWQRSK